jgi:hypothetical protein
MFSAKVIGIAIPILHYPSASDFVTMSAYSLAEFQCIEPVVGEAQLLVLPHRPEHIFFNRGDFQD